MSSLVSSAFDTLRAQVGSVAWGPLVRLSRKAVLSVLQQVEVGRLLVQEHDGSETVCGKKSASSAAPATELKVHRETFWVRLALFADMVSFAFLPCNRRLD
jgi:cyclopropane-fatty-acyl-phospholipid synthase